MHNFKYKNGKEVNVYLNNDNPKYRDWEVISLFYSSLHLVENYCENHGIVIPRSHSQREEVVSRYLSEIEIAYLELYTLSKNARYESLIGDDELITAKNDYDSIEAYVLPLI